MTATARHPPAAATPALRRRARPRRRAAAGAARRRRRPAARPARAPRRPRPRARRPRARPQRAHRARARRLGGRRSTAAADARRPRARVALRDCEAVLPVRVPDFVDFYASLEHATNFGRIFRPGTPPVRDNWRHMPIGYHGRASTIVVSGTDIRAPARADGARRRWPPRAQLDLECELGYVCGPSAQRPDRRSTAPPSTSSASCSSTTGARATSSAWSTSRSARSSASRSRRRSRPGSRRCARSTAPAPRRRRRTRRRRPTSSRRDPWLLDVALEIELNGERRLAPAGAPACTGRRRRCSPT